MRIYGGRDYYDSVLAWGQDPKTVFVRDPNLTFLRKDVPLKLDLLDLTLWSRQLNHLEARWVVVVFCSKVYRGLRVAMNGNHLHFWSVEKLKAWAKEKEVTIRPLRRWSRHDSKAFEDGTYMDPLEVNDALREFMMTHRIAILLDAEERRRAEDLKIRVNPSHLKKIEFAKVVDPFTAYQELSMWISGVLGGSSPAMVRITDDKVLLESHGFDKHSFRSSVRG